MKRFCVEKKVAIGARPGVFIYRAATSPGFAVVAFPCVAPGIYFSAAKLLLPATRRPLFAAQLFVFCHPLCLGCAIYQPLRFFRVSPTAFTTRPVGCFFLIRVAPRSWRISLYFVIPCVLALASLSRCVFSSRRVRHLSSGRQVASSCYLSPVGRGVFLCILSSLVSWLWHSPPATFFASVAPARSPLIAIGPPCSRRIFLYFVIPYVLFLAFAIGYAVFICVALGINYPAARLLLLGLWRWHSSSATLSLCVSPGMYYPAARLLLLATCRTSLAPHLVVFCHPL